MLVFIDESGDPGFKITRGSTSHFVVAMVLFDDEKDAERTSAQVETLRKRLRVHPEFKFSKSNNQIRDAFFEQIVKCNFRVRALVVEKSAVHSDHLRTETDRFYNFFVRQVLDHDNDRLVNARVKIDGSGDRKFKREMSAYLRRELKAGKICDFKYKDSASNNLLQLADMVAGAILRAHRSDGRNGRWLAMLHRGNRIENLWPFR